MAGVIAEPTMTYRRLEIKDSDMLSMPKAATTMKLSDEVVTPEKQVFRIEI